MVHMITLFFYPVVYKQFVTLSCGCFCHVVLFKFIPIPRTCRFARKSFHLSACCWHVTDCDPFTFAWGNYECYRWKLRDFFCESLATEKKRCYIEQIYLLKGNGGNYIRNSFSVWPTHHVIDSTLYAWIKSTRKQSHKIKENPMEMCVWKCLISDCLSGSVCTKKKKSNFHQSLYS